MKLVTIKRATTGAISTCYGELYKCGEFYFCITDNVESGMINAIEPSTGMNAYSDFISMHSSQRACKNSVKRWIKEHINFFDNDLLERSKKELSKYGYEYPLNIKK